MELIDSPNNMNSKSKNSPKYLMKSKLMKNSSTLTLLRTILMKKKQS